MKRRWRSMKWWWKGVLLLAAAIAVIHGAATFIMARELERAIAAIHSQGDPVSPAELAEPRIPDSRNGAFEYLNAFVVMRVNTAQLEQRVKAASQPKNPTPPAAAMTPATSMIPMAPTMPFVSPVRRVTDSQRLPYVEQMQLERWDAGSWRLARAFVSANVAAFRLIEQAQSKPGCRFYVNWADGPEAQYPYISGIRQASHLLGIRSVLCARDGRMDDAVRDLGRSIRLVDTLKDDRTLLHQLIRFSLLSTVNKSLQAVTEQHPLNMAQCSQISSYLSRLELGRAYLQSMKGELAMTMSIFGLATKASPIISQMTGASEGSTPPLMARLVSSYAWRPFLYADELASIRLRDAQIRAASQPYREILSNGHDRVLQDQVNQLPPYCFLTSILTPGFAGPIAQRDIATATVRGCSVYLGLMAYKDRHGAYPRSLSELRSRLVWKVQEDPLSGKPFIYRRAGDGFLLYSIGANLRDDKGMRDPKTLGRADGGLDDIAWRDPASERRMRN